MKRKSELYSVMCFNGALMSTYRALRVHVYHFCRRSLEATIATLFILGDAQAEASDLPPRLTVRPTQCVVLEQGQKCHANVRVEWKVGRPSSVCLHNSLVQKPLKCWEDAIDGIYQEKVIARSSVYYFLKPAGADEVLAEAELNVAWVYRESRRPTRQWRLF